MLSSNYKVAPQHGLICTVYLAALAAEKLGWESYVAGLINLVNLELKDAEGGGGHRQNVSNVPKGHLRWVSLSTDCPPLLTVAKSHKGTKNSAT
jgi:hypothetical protein